MNEQESRIGTLLEKYEKNTATDEELQELDQWYASFEDRPVITASMSASEQETARERLLLSINQQINRKIRIRIWPRIAVAAALLAIITTLLLYRQPASLQMAAEPAPGGNKAVLTLSNGEQIVLDEAANGQLAIQQQTVISKTADGEITYNAGKAIDTNLVYNTVTTPRGGQYHLVLSDGTDIWLNAASSITYPAKFSGKNREVEITGEVYFKVSPDAGKPFRVKSRDQQIEVLGTQFNINAYTDEAATSTTLVEGSVMVHAGHARKTLEPGQQAIRENNGIKVVPADIRSQTAWKDGYFHFVDADIKTVMRQISRWYDVEVVFEGPVTNETFTGRISRDRSISQVLKIVQESKSIQLTFKERRIMIK